MFEGAPTHGIDSDTPDAIVIKSLEVAFRGVNPSLGLAEREQKARNVALFVMQQLRTEYDLVRVQQGENGSIG